MKVTQEYGGAVLGAMTGGKVLGFIYAFLARRGGRLIHWSHLMAVRPELRGQGLGLEMKLAHRKLALSQNISSICWTFDPLQSRNAALNIGRLGATVEEYVADCYGRFPSAIEKGLPSDRFVLNWRIATRDVQIRLRSRPLTAPDPRAERINLTSFNSRGFLLNRRTGLNLRSPRLLYEIPSHTDDMRIHSLPLARRWRIETRKVFSHYLAAGYRIRDFISPQSLSVDRCFYVLTRSGNEN